MIKVLGANAVESTKLAQHGEFVISIDLRRVSS